MSLPYRFVPPVWFCNSLVCACITSDSTHHGEVVLVDDLLHLLDRFQVAQHITTGCENFSNSSRWLARTHPTEHMVLLSEISLATLKASSISLLGPVAMGFSMNMATPGKLFIICSSMSRLGCVVPLNIGGDPTTTARGFSLGDMFLTKSSRVLNTRVF